MRKKTFFLALAVFVLVATVGFANGSGDKNSGTVLQNGMLPLSMTSRLSDPIPDMNNPYWKAYQEKASWLSEKAPARRKTSWAGPLWGEPANYWI